MGTLSRREFVAMSVGAAALTAVSSSETSFAGTSSTTEELLALSLSEVSRRIHARQVTSVELTQAVLDRIKIYNPKVNAYITVIRSHHRPRSTRAAPNSGAVLRIQSG